MNNSRPFPLRSALLSLLIAPLLLVSCSRTSEIAIEEVEKPVIVNDAAFDKEKVETGEVSTDAAADDGHFEDEIHDPLESMNRGIFWFNDQFDIYLLGPVARGYDSIAPEVVQTGIGNFFSNLSYPKYLLSDIVQGKFSQAGSHTARFVINTTIGVLGFMDFATDMGFEDHKEDFGIALAYHEVPAGPYIVLPLLGPSNLRDGIGRLVDILVDPFTIWSYTTNDSAVFTASITAKVIDTIDTRAKLEDTLKTAKESALDYYLFMQSAYYQYRRGVLYDGHPPEQALALDDDEFGDISSDDRAKTSK